MVIIEKLLTKIIEHILKNKEKRNFRINFRTTMVVMNLSVRNT